MLGDTEQYEKQPTATAEYTVAMYAPSFLTSSAIKPPIHPVLPPKMRTRVMGVGSVEEAMVEVTVTSER